MHVILDEPELDTRLNEIIKLISLDKATKMVILIRHSSPSARFNPLCFALPRPPLVFNFCFCFFQKLLSKLAKLCSLGCRDIKFSIFIA